MMKTTIGPLVIHSMINDHKKNWCHNFDLVLEENIEGVPEKTR